MTNSEKKNGKKTDHALIRISCLLFWEINSQAYLCLRCVVMYVYSALSIQCVSFGRNMQVGKA